MFGFRRIAYMLLSRHFWVGVGVGFFLASVFVVGTVSAQSFPQYIDTSIREESEFCQPSSASTRYIKASVNQTAGTSTDFYIYNSSATPSTLTGCQYWRQLTSSKLWVATTTQLIANVSVDHTSGSCGWFAYTTGTTSPDTSNYDIVQYTADSASSTVTWTMNTNAYKAGLWVGMVFRNGQSADCTIKLRSIRDSLGNEYLDFLDTTAGGGSSATTTVFYPLGLNAIINDMNCLSSATGTDCAFTYATTTQFSTDIWLFYMVCWFIGFSVVLYIIQKLT